MSLESDLRDAITDAAKSRDGLDGKLSQKIHTMLEENGKVTEIHAEVGALVELIVMVVSAHESEPPFHFPSWMTRS